MYKIIYMCLLLVLVSGAPQVFVTRRLKVGIEYENSLPVSGGSDRYKHRNNLDPFYITVTASARKNFVISYLDITTITDEEGDVEFNLLRGGTGSRTAVFQLVSNNTEFLSYSYLVYAINENEYKKNVPSMTLFPNQVQSCFSKSQLMMNIITLPRNSSTRFQTKIYSILISMLLTFRLIFTN